MIVYNQKIVSGIMTWYLLLFLDLPYPSFCTEGLKLILDVATSVPLNKKLIELEMNNRGCFLKLTFTNLTPAPSVDFQLKLSLMLNRNRTSTHSNRKVCIFALVYVIRESFSYAFNFRSIPYFLDNKAWLENKHGSKISLKK